MFEFNMDAFLRDKRISIPELAKQVSIPFQSLYYIRSKKKIAPRLLRTIEKKFGDCSIYLSVSN